MFDFSVINGIIWMTTQACLEKITMVKEQKT